jgi:hypothetical protein
MTPPGWPAALVLENGRVFRGRGFGARVESIGEVVFNTSITGYQEIVSDPSYAGQIVVMTATQIGNVGVNKDDVETRKIACAGLAIRELSPVPASWHRRHARRLAGVDRDPGHRRHRHPRVDPRPPRRGCDARCDHAARRRARRRDRAGQGVAQDGRARPRAARDLRGAVRVERADLARRR